MRDRVRSVLAETLDAGLSMADTTALVNKELERLQKSRPATEEDS